jgi:hypothetical protein
MLLKSSAARCVVLALPEDANVRSWRALASAIRSLTDFAGTEG